MSEPDFILEGLNAYQNESGLRLTTDAYLLSAFVPENKAKTVCELCAGSGIISLLLLNKGKCKSAVCVDFQPELCKIAEQNAKINNCSDRMTSVCSDVLAYRPNVKFDRVVCNPPYLKQNIGKINDREERFLSLHETTATIYDITSAAARALIFGGEAFFCYIPERTPALFDAMKASGIEPKELITVYPTIRHKPSLILVKGKKGAKDGMTTNPPIIIYETTSKGEYSAQMREIYETNRIK